MKNNKFTIQQLDEVLSKIEAHKAKLSKTSANKTNTQPTILVEVPTKRRLSSTLLFIVSGILAYAHKIPVVNKLIKLLSLWYGRTTWST